MRGQPYQIVDNSVGLIVIDETSNVNKTQSQNIQSNTQKTDDIYKFRGLDSDNPLNSHTNIKYDGWQDTGAYRGSSNLNNHTRTA